ncbi:CHAT domain-containing protein [Actinosynnema sp. NPDC091369]
MTPRDRLALLERELRVLSRSAAVGRAGVRLDDVVDALGERALLVLISHRGRLVGASVVGGRVRVHDFGVARHVPPSGDVAALDRLLRPAGDRAVVVVPSPELARVPWGALPSARGRAVSVAPSVGCWFRAASRPLAVAERLWVAGRAGREVDALRAAHGGRVCSTVDDALRGMINADVVHFAARGVRQDELFSYFSLADGPLHGHDLAGLARVPSVVVLPAGESGLARQFLRRGARVVVESVQGSVDERVVGLMAELHANLDHPAQALADAQARHGDLGFVCLGAG